MIVKSQQNRIELVTPLSPAHHHPAGGEHSRGPGLGVQNLLASADPPDPEGAPPRHQQGAVGDRETPFGPAEVRVNPQRLHAPHSSTHRQAL